MQSKMDKYNGNTASFDTTAYIGKLSQLKQTKSGTDFIEFSVFALINKERFWYNNIIAYDQNARELHSYAKKKMKITLSAFPEEKTWKDKNTGKNITKLVKHVNQLSLHINDLTTNDRKNNNPPKETIDDDYFKLIAINDLWSKSTPLTNTIGEKYLKEHRHIKDTSNLEIRFIPKGTKMALSDQSIKPAFEPMIVIAAYNEKDELRLVQRIYIDSKTANKSQKIDTPKLSMGFVKGSAGLIQKGNNGILYIAEGPETAASISQIDKQSSIYCSFAAGNFIHLIDFIKAKKFKKAIIAADNDGDNKISKGLINDSIKAMKEQHINIKVVYPPLIEGTKKTDWNDILVLFGKDKLKEYLEK